MCYLPSSESGENLHCLSEHLECEISHHIYTCTSPLIRQLNMGTPTVVSYFVSCTLLRSLQVEVSVSLLPPVADAGWCNVVLVLSSAAPVNWALVTPGLRGHITVHVRHLSLFFFLRRNCFYHQKYHTLLRWHSIPHLNLSLSHLTVSHLSILPNPTSPWAASSSLTSSQPLTCLPGPIRMAIPLWCHIQKLI